MIITKKHLPRRTFLRGALGTMVALPFLDAMIPALSAQSKARPFRFGAIYVPNGIYPQLWHPDKTGSDFEFKPIMKPLEPYRQLPGDHQQDEGAGRQSGEWRRAHGRQRGMAERRRAAHPAGELHGDPVEEDDRPVHRRQDRRRYSAAIASGRHRRHGNVRRRLRRLSLRLL